MPHIREDDKGVNEKNEKRSQDDTPPDLQELGQWARGYGRLGAGRLGAEVFKKTFLKNVYGYFICKYVCTMCIPSALRDQERVPGALRLESETGVVLKIKLKSSGKTTSALKC